MVKNKVKSSFLIFAELSKIKIPFAVAFSAFTGYILFKQAVDVSALIATFGVFLLAGGSAALNQYQEFRLDILMDRTQNRPIPSGQFSAGSTLIFSIVFSAIGAAILLFGANFTAFLIGLLTLVWYNGIYTPLKKRTVFAVLAGAFVGAFPPLIGWAAAGGNVFDSEILMIAVLLFIWQVPHFILLLLKYGKEYEIAGFSALTSYLSEAQLRKVIFIWILATAFAVIIIIVSGMIGSKIIITALMASSVWLIFTFYFILKRQQVNFKMAFIQINLFLLLVLALFSVDSLL